MSAKRCIVVGLGEFGRTIAVELARLGVEVLAVDQSDNRVMMVRDEVASAVSADARDPEVFNELCSTSFDLAIIAIGGSLEASILAAMHLMHHKVGEIWAEANDPAREEVLAQRIARQDLAEFIPIAEGHGVIEMRAPNWMVGKTLVQLDLRNTHNVSVISVRSAGGEVTVVPKAGREIREGDTLVLVGKDEDLAKVRGRD
jgi:trk system potassium uptake protein TrkA